jgi:hypothetical protein
MKGSDARDCLSPTEREFSFDELLKLHDLYRRHVEHENSLASLRMNWLLAAQPFYVAALAVTFSRDFGIIGTGLQFWSQTAILLFASIYSVLFIVLIGYSGMVLEGLDRHYEVAVAKISSPQLALLPTIRWAGRRPPRFARIPSVPAIFTALWCAGLLTRVWIHP